MRLPSWLKKPVMANPSGPITGVILNWKRRKNVLRILDGWQSSGLVSEAMVWNNNPDITFRHDWASVINTNKDLGLYTRFAAACLAKNECVLIQDDDILLPVESLNALYQAWLDDPEVLHGLFGRAPKPDGSYADMIQGDQEAPVVLTRALLSHRRHAAAFFDIAPDFSVLQQEGIPAGNGEDILFNYAVRKSSGRLNRVHDLKAKELRNGGHAIHKRNEQAHFDHRTRLMRACEIWLAKESGSPD